VLQLDGIGRGAITMNSIAGQRFVAYVVMIVLGLFLPVLAVLGYLAIAIYLLVPFRAMRYRSPHA
jgi:hypothetical protein